MGQTDKSALRKMLYEQRARAAKEAPHRAQAMAEHLRVWLDAQGAVCAGGYMPFRSEPDVNGMLQEWKRAQSGRRLALPVVDDARLGRMHYALWEEGTAFCKGAFGIVEPVQSPTVVPDIMLSPCVGVSPEGWRLGNGGGFFDRYLAACDVGGVRPVTVAVALDCLIVERLQPAPHDMRFDWIATESGMRRVR
ncbi:MAG: 5-formyltetrahydrofolate cyclo-ligase [Duodenibacillus sp.]